MASENDIVEKSRFHGPEIAIPPLALYSLMVPLAGSKRKVRVEGPQRPLHWCRRDPEGRSWRLISVGQARGDEEADPVVANVR